VKQKPDAVLACLAKTQQKNLSVCLLQRDTTQNKNFAKSDERLLKKVQLCVCVALF